MALEPQKAGLASQTLKTGFEFTVLTLPYPLKAIIILFHDFGHHFPFTNAFISKIKTFIEKRNNDLCVRTSHAIKEARTENWKQQQGDENNIKENSLELESFSKLLSQLSHKSHLYTFRPEQKENFLVA